MTVLWPPFFLEMAVLWRLQLLVPHLQLRLTRHASPAYGRASLSSYRISSFLSGLHLFLSPCMPNGRTCVICVCDWHVYVKMYIYTCMFSNCFFHLVHSTLVFKFGRKEDTEAWWTACYTLTWMRLYTNCAVCGVFHRLHYKIYIFYLSLYHTMSVLTIVWI